MPGNRTNGQEALQYAVFPLDAFIAEAAQAAQLDATAPGCAFTVKPVEPALGLETNRDALLAALGNLLSNAFKFTHPHSEVTLSAYPMGNQIQRSDDRSGLGLGLSIARQSVEADGGTLNVRDLPGAGCVFTINLPRRPAP